MRGIAGVSRDLARFDQSAIDASAPAGPITSNIGFDGEAWSWRAGLAYEIPTAAMVASIVYYAPLPFDIHGRIDQLPLGDHAFLASVPIAGETTFPQAIEGSVQGLIAPGWIMGASVKWMDWSVLDHVPLRTSTDVGLLPANTTAVDFKTFFRDGWTFGLFAGHQIDNDWSIGVKVLWDRGVATGWTEHTASWSAFGAVQYRLNQSIDISGGLAYVGLSGGAIDKRKEGAPFDAIFGDGYALVPRLGITARF